MIASPFKLLDAYTAADKADFWGRDEESASLYSMVMQNRLILVYGQSGTGKTSLVQCGLAARFDKTDWFPLFVRRQQDLNASVQSALSNTLRRPVPNAPDALADALEEVYETFLRPAYLIFDQLEEVFILGTAQEQVQFIQSIRTVLDRPIPCRVLFIIREEYLAHLYGFERVIPTLFDRRLRVEPMGAAKVDQVLDGSFKRYNIQLETPAAALRKKIVDYVSGGKAGIQLPYLQVYLDMLYREDFARTYPDRPNAEGWPALQFTTAEVERLGKIDNVLERFLLEQEARIQSTLPSKAPSDAVRKVLDAFVSEEGTKRPIGYQWEGETLRIEPRWAALFQPLDPTVIRTCCRELEQARLLRFTDRQMELAHDALAALIDQRRSAQERRLQEAYARLQHQYRAFADTGEWLSRRQLNAIEDLMPLLEPRLSSEVKQFIQNSRSKAEDLEQAELLAERRKRRQALTLAAAGLTLAAIAVVAAFIAYRARREMAQKAYEAQRKTALVFKVEGKYPEALDALTSVEAFAANASAQDAAEVRQLRADWAAIARYVTTGDSIRNWVKTNQMTHIGAVGYLPQALQAYQQAHKISPDAYLGNLLKQTPEEMRDLFGQYKRAGKAMAANNKDSLAQLYFETAFKLKPDDPEIQKLIIDN